MSKTVTLRVSQPVYEMFLTMAKRENRPLSNFIETAVLRYVEEHQLADEFEMGEISGNAELNASLKRGYDDAKTKRGHFV
jgi:predicted transcriptional regulator